MQSRQTIIHRIPAIATFLALLLGSTALHADRILAIGDSWAEPIGDQLRIVLAENEHTDIIVQATPFWGRAKRLSSPNGLDAIAKWLDDWPDTIIMYLSIGGNDWTAQWTPALIGTQEEVDLFTEIVGDVETIVDHIFSIRPDVQILWPSYDFTRPFDLGTPTEINAVQIQMAELAMQLAMAKSGLNFVDLMGTLQVTYGFDGIQHTPFDPSSPIPAGDPSLPDSTLPSPYEAFNPGDWAHPNTAGYKVLAQAQYELFYEPLLNDQNFQINSGLNDAWYNPATNGQGFLISVFPDRREMFVAWFTFDTERPPEDVTAFLGEPGHRWLTAQGPYDGDTANLIIFVTEGGVFDAAEPVATTDLAGDGTLTLEFADCTEGLVNYEITSLGISGEIPIERITPDNVALCETLGSP
jgi:hypothetical protein